MSALRLPNGAREVRYDYAGSGAEAMLVRATYPGGKSRQYRYDDARHPTALTAIVDARGITFASWGYDAQGRAISSERAGGKQRVELTFNADGTTTVAEPAKGLQRTYHFIAQHGLLKVSKVVGGGAGCGSCGGGATAYQYDRNGRVALVQDPQGVRTRFEYGADGRIARRVEAVGTAQQRCTSYGHDAARRRLTRLARHAGCGEVLQETLWHYDAAGRLKREEIRDPRSPLRRELRYDYDAVGRLRLVDGPRSDVPDETRFLLHRRGLRQRGAPRPRRQPRK